ncbi:hypothetical protein OsI_34448 [Oryza sativa Indica Group]|uniref:Uncharacterized protein n=1 Tax=Oryza sativa subsp. indica TaxID=39946 RepID=B8BI00_ORYSI|nr:hypothetical protein OsI_34448 [Oryza sativa Indica Group]
MGGRPHLGFGEAVIRSSTALGNLSVSLRITTKMKTGPHGDAGFGEGVESTVEMVKPCKEIVAYSRPFTNDS